MVQLLSFLDGLGNGLGYSIILIGVATIREKFLEQGLYLEMKYFLLFQMGDGIWEIIYYYFLQAHLLLLVYLFLDF